MGGKFDYLWWQYIYSFFSEEEQLTNNDYNYYCEFSNETFSCTVHLMISGGTLLANIREK